MVAAFVDMCVTAAVDQLPSRRIRARGSDSRVEAREIRAAMPILIQPESRCLSARTNTVVPLGSREKQNEEDGLADRKGYD